MELDAAGRIPGVRYIASPNCDERPEGESVTLVVVHAISLPPCEFGGPWIEDLFLNRLDCTAHPYFESLRGLQVSAHFFLRRTGLCIQFVDIGRKAWHRG